MDDGWTNVRIRKEIYKQIQQWLKTSLGKKSSKTNPAQVIEMNMLKFFNDNKMKRFEHYDLNGNIINVLDLDIGENGDIIKLIIKNKQIKCEYCKNSDCIHIKFVYTDSELSNKLSKIVK